MKKILVSAIFSACSLPVIAQKFQPVDTLHKGAYGAAIWGDFDGDGKIDLAYGAQNVTIGGSDSMNIYRNTGAGFVKVPQRFLYTPNPVMGAVDIDGDGREELLYSGSGVDTMFVYTSNGIGGFKIMPGVYLPRVTGGCMAIADYNNDGFPDIFLAGFAKSPSRISRIYKGGPGGAFTDINAPIPALTNGEAKWGDYDGDGLKDLLLVGQANNSDSIMVYKNMGGDVFSKAVSLAGGTGTVDWIDYNGDTKLDIVAAVFTKAFINTTFLYRNNGIGGFVKETTNLPGYGEPSAVAIADFNLDGRPDIFLAGGSDLPGGKSILALGTGTSNFFLDTTLRSDHLNSIAETADFNNDGRPDLFVSNIIVQNVGVPSAIANNLLSRDLKLFPNPATHQLQLQWNSL